MGLSSTFRAVRPRFSLPFLAAWPVLVLAHVGVFLENQTLSVWFYPLVWWPYIAILDGAGVRRGEPSIFARSGRLLGLILASWAFWLLFEAINLRIANWYYVGVPENRLLRWGGISLSFATVIPLLEVTTRAVSACRWIGPCRLPTLAVTPARLAGTQTVGWLFLVLPLAFPRYAFALVWGFLALLLEPSNYRAGRPSLLADLARGDGRRIVCLLTAGLIAGLLWETWNRIALGKWIYTVPWLTESALFEMPPLGFFGFPALAIEAFVFLVWVDALWERLRVPARIGLVVATLLAGAAVMGAIDRYTVDAAAPTLAGVRVLNQAEQAGLGTAGLHQVRPLADLSDAGVESLAAAAGVAPGRLSDARDWARLARHRGMGNENTALLWGIGIRRVDQLAGLSEDALAGRLGKAAPARQKLAIWIRAAGRD
ncbi:MAG: DUF4332 domain-containing protein [Leptospirillia bacterium]